jgi:hypothetical protein
MLAAVAAEHFLELLAQAVLEAEEMEQQTLQ